MALFRREAMAGRGQALDGAVSLAVPLSWQIVGGLLFAAIAGAALFLTLANTDRVLALETAIASNGRAVAVLPQSDAALLPSEACGTITFAGDGVAMPTCATGVESAASHLLPSGDVVIGQAVRLRLSKAAPAGARGTTRFMIGRESLWASLTR